MSKGVIFDIKRFAVHDGPGIRTTVFFKGCPLHCLWCHNPEGIAKNQELMVRSSRCARCYSCVDACPREAISRNSGPISVDRAKCDLCGECVKVCMYEALEMAGRVVSVMDVVREIERDRIFFEQSGGGVTLSGGEPASQPDFCQSLLAEMNKRSIHAALDTSGLSKWDALWKCANRADLILYDLKFMDEKKHLKYTGVSNAPVLENLKKLAAAKKDIVARIPLMSGVNDDDDNIQGTIDFLRRLETVEKVSLLRYHKGGREKYKNLDRVSSFQIYEPPSEKRMEEIRRKFTDAGFHVRIGG
jgi:pyruvate formate lyase activating enzyme